MEQKIINERNDRILPYVEENITLTEQMEEDIRNG
jgi:hypothetical protein